MKIKGIGASSGISIAKVFELIETKVEIKNKKSDPKKEIIKFKDASNKAVKSIKLIKENALKKLGKKEASIFDAHIQVATDPVMIGEINELIKKEQTSAIYATHVITEKYIKMFSNMEDEYMKERAADIQDVAKRVINILAGVKAQDVTSINSEVIIVADDLTPSDTAQLDRKFVKGFLTNVGGRTSHAAIMARTLEIPAVLGLTNITKKVKTGDTISLNGDTGEVIINPSKKEILTLRNEIEEFKKEKAETIKFIGKKSETKDGKEVKIAANIGSPSDMESVKANDANAIGLFRSEFLYMDAKDWPTEDEQYEAYKKVLVGMEGKQVVVRTLDIGGDKTLSYYKFPKEMNPFLGYRAIRLSLDKKNIFVTQLRALIRASAYGTLAIMFPMIATIDEYIKAKKIFERTYEQLMKEGVKIAPREKIELGMMVEVPSAAALAKQFAKHVDFFSIGTNDLMQYTMAADRMSEKVSYLYQPLNPSILTLINMTIQGAHAEGKWVGMCGEMAGDKNAIPLLVGMGLDEFSMSATSILKARRQISTINQKEAAELVERSLVLDTQEQVTKLVKKFIQK